MSFQRALMALTAMALLAGILPAVIAIQNRSEELEGRARSELALAPRLLTDLNRRVTSELQVEAVATARAPGLSAALTSGDHTAAARALESVGPLGSSRSVLVAADGTVWTGPAGAADLATITRRGASTLGLVTDGDSLAWVALTCATPVST